MNMDRVLPIIGEAFKGKNILFPDPTAITIVDTIARTGGNVYIYPDPMGLTSIFKSKYGDVPVYNSSPNKVDLLVHFGSIHELLRILPVQAGYDCPAIFGHIGRGVISAYYAASIKESLKYIQRLTDRQNTTSLLAKYDVADLLGFLVKAIVMQDDEQHRCAEIHKAIFVENRKLLLRAATNKTWLVNADSYTWDIPSPETEYDHLKNRIIMVIGCGTGSLFIASAANYFPHMILVDHKPFSEYNLVRQACTKEMIESKEIKSIALANYLNANSDEGYTIGVDKEVASRDDVDALIAEFNPDLVVVATGETQGVNHEICARLRELRVPYVVPSCLPSALYHKIIFSKSNGDPCYSCFQGRIKQEAQAPKLNTEARDLFYGGTQPATLFETLPSAHAVLKVVLALLDDKPSWLTPYIEEEKQCLLWANAVQINSHDFLYGLDAPGTYTAYSTQDLRYPAACQICGRKNGDPLLNPCLYCNDKEANDSGFCCRSHEALYKVKMQKAQKDALPF